MSGNSNSSSGQTRGIEHILDKWRGLIKSKKRMIISLEEIIGQKIESLRPWIIQESRALSGWQRRHFRYDRHRRREWVDDDWAPIKPGEHWGAPDMSCYFRLTGAQIPPEFAGKEVALRVYFSGDGLLRINGEPYHGLDPFRDFVPLPKAAEPTEKYDLEVESYINWHFGEGSDKTFEISEWVCLDREMEEIYWDLKAVYNLLITEGLPSDLTALLRQTLHEATKPIEQECRQRAAVVAQARKARQLAREKIYECQQFKRPGLLHLCGNSHLDLVYLWTHAEYERKIGRTHATALRLMEEYPEYIFSQSQPQMYDRLRELYPGLYAQIKERIAQGRWEAVGAFWVEPDCNLISGESMARQLLHGVGFYQREFGVRPKTAWIPDVFGCAFSMPQILKQAGLEYFVTHKMNVWNDTNKWQHHVFWWEGPDGSRIFATVPPTHFIGVCEPEHLNTHWDDYSAQATVPESLYCYGWGDGGGGPDKEMLEYCKRYRQMPGVVPGRFSRIEDGLARMKQLAEQQPDLPVLQDELYLEEHRGVYTTKGKLKKLNRRLEYLLRDAEMLSVLSGGEYPLASLNAAWEDLLTSQFHDSLPGTHVREAYFELLDMLAGVEQKAVEALSAAAKAEILAAPLAAAGEVSFFNSEPAGRTQLVEVACEFPAARVTDAAGNEVPAQMGADFATGQSVAVFLATAPGGGWAPYKITPAAAGAGAEKSRDLILANKFLRAEFNQQGELVSLQANGREFIDPDKRANVFALYEDMPGTFDAWDIEMHYEDTEFPLPPAQATPGEKGEVFSTIIIKRKFLASTIEQRVRLGKESRQLEFATRIDWQERHKLLKVRFNTNLRARTATYDIAYANIERPTTRNNSYEEAKFEVPGHEWADLSQPDGGLAILTDCKYGYECRGGRLGLTMLKGPMYPDPESDLEEHTFTYSLLPHAGGWRAAAVIAEARQLNAPFHLFANAKPTPAAEFVLPTAGITFEALKKAADGSDDIILRLVERHGENATLQFSPPLQAAEAYLCNLLEERAGEVDFTDGNLRLNFSPYEIKSIRFKTSPLTER